MKKIIAILLAGMMTATAFAGCGGSGDSSTGDDGSKGGESSQGTTVEVKDAKVDSSVFGEEDNIKLKVWAPNATIELAKKQCEEFKKIYSDKKIDIEVVAQGEDEAATNLMNDSEAAADVYSFASDQLNKLYEAKVIKPVAEAFKGYVTENNLKPSVEAATIDGTLYAYPQTSDNSYCLVYDNSVVSDEDAKTLEGVLEACQKAGKKFIFDAGTGYYSITFAYTAGVKTDGTEDIDDTATQKFTEYDKDTAVKTLQAVGKLIKKYKGTFTSLAANKIASGFTNGTCGAGVDGTWDTKANETALGDKFSAAKLPTVNVDGTDQQLINVFGYKYIGVNVNSKFPIASQILALYLSGSECQIQRAEEYGWGPSNVAAQESDVVKNSKMLKAITEQAEHSCPQLSITDTTWAAMGTLGKQLTSDKFNPDDEAAVTQLLEDTIATARDEG